MWKKLWKLKVPNKIKVYGWRACQDILPTRANLARRKILEDEHCEVCKTAPETGIHALWECPVAQDVWSGSLVRLQKCTQGYDDVLQLFGELLNRLSREEFELFLTLSWVIWNQRNTVIHGGKIKDPGQLCKRAEVYLLEYRQAQDQLSIPSRQQSVTQWQPPPIDRYKLNFDAAIFTELGCSGFGAIVRNERGEVMAALSVKGPLVWNSEEAEALACRRAVEFVIDAGFAELMIEGDNVNVMKAVCSNSMDKSRLGHVFQDIQCLVHGLRWSSVSCVKRGANGAAHSLARFARYVSEETIWLEECPPPASDALYQDLLSLN